MLKKIMKIIKNYDKNISSYFMYLNAKNFYGCRMSQKSPVNGFKWIKRFCKFSNDFIIKIVIRDIFLE